jgi:hypothetical protein
LQPADDICACEECSLQFIRKKKDPPEPLVAQEAMEARSNPPPLEDSGGILEVTLELLEDVEVMLPPQCVGGLGGNITSEEYRRYWRYWRFHMLVTPLLHYAHSTEVARNTCHLLALSIHASVI